MNDAVLKPAVFLDRDGTINGDTNYVHKVDERVWEKGAIEAMQALQGAGYALVITTNQGGIARGYYREAEVHQLHEWVQGELKPYGVVLAGAYLCPHHPAHGECVVCECRKPMPGMLRQAATELNLDLSRSWMVGDKVSDINAGIAAGVRTVLVETGHGFKNKPLCLDLCPCVAGIQEAAAHILKHRRDF